jgi:hypothetical protein
LVEVWASAFGCIPEDSHIHHKDKNPSNNGLDNLEKFYRHLGNHRARMPYKNFSDIFPTCWAGLPAAAKSNHYLSNWKRDSTGLFSIISFTSRPNYRRKSNHIGGRAHQRNLFGTTDPQWGSSVDFNTSRTTTPAATAGHRAAPCICPATRI